MAATGNADFGYFGGGEPSNKSIVDRIDYSNDTANAVTKGPLSAARQACQATGSSFFGYFGGGAPSKSTVDRIDYSNDTATASARGPLSAARYFMGATGNQNFGYFGGGYVYPSPTNARSTVDRIDYSNDTPNTSTKGPLSLARWGVTATGNTSFGYFGGGTPTSGPSAKSTVDRIDYGNDTVEAVEKGSLSHTKIAMAATGNADFGYFGGGEPSPVSTVSRIDYSNDTATASPKGPLSVSKTAMAATGNKNFGYFAGGNPGPVSTIDRLDYANDDVTASPKGELSINRHTMGACSAGANALPQ